MKLCEMRFFNDLSIKNRFAWSFKEKNFPLLPANLYEFAW